MRLWKLALVLTVLSSAAQAEMQVQFGGGWGGRNVPSGQQCTLDGGNGGTPPMQVSGVPAGAVWVVAYFNDLDYQPLSRNGGHGVIAFPANSAVANLPAVPGLTNRLPGGAQVISAARSSGNYASPGYLPPCSGGKDHRYTVDLVAIDSGGQVLGRLDRVSIGRY